MPIVTFAGKGITLEVEKGTLVSDCIKRAGLFLETPCNCMALCGKCRVTATGELSGLTAEEAGFLHGEKDIRLACLARVEGDVEIGFCSPSRELKTVEKGYTADVEPDSDIKPVELPGIDKGSSLPYLGTLPYKINSRNALEQLGVLEAEGASSLYGIVCGDKLLNISGEPKAVLGVAVDIGTTGVSAYLVNLTSGEVLRRISCLNPQTQYGGDVLTRISYCISNENGAGKLREAITDKIDELVGSLVAGIYERDEVYRVTIAGNTTMQHLFLGVNPITMARAPYRPIFVDKLDLSPADSGIGINKDGMVTLLPSASGYIGADILAGVAATRFDRRRDAALFIDIGTNGEIVAANNGRMAATSTAAGPALEGMNISCGCRAEEGAIDSFSIDEEFNITYTTIGDVPPIGICGSGLIDIAAELVRNGIIMKTGNFNPDMDARVKDRYREKKFYINDKVFLSQKDIRQIQLAKGAIATGIAMLISEIGISLESVEEAVIAGAFGYHINPESIKAIGLIPKGFKGNITFVGNSSVEGARLALINRQMLERIVELKDEITVVELSTKESFQEYFVKELGF